MNRYIIGSASLIGAFLWKLDQELLYSILVGNLDTIHERMDSIFSREARIWKNKKYGGIQNISSTPTLGLSICDNGSK